MISLNGSGTVILEVGDSYTDAGAEYSDNVDGTGSLTASGTVNTSGTGSFTLTYDYTDTAGNPAVQVSRIVNVLDTTSPVITVTGSGTVNHLVGSFYIDANATCSDNLDSSCSVTAS